MGDNSAESNRIKALHDLEILDTLEEQEFDDIVELASILCGTKIALISFVDSDRQWFKSAKGLSVKETSRKVSFCSHAIEDKTNPFIVQDARKDERFAKNPLVTGNPNIQFYAGIPLVDKNDHALGTLCVIDDEVKEITTSQVDGLKILARNVLRIIELRSKNLSLQKEKEAFGATIDLNNPFFFILNDRDELDVIGSKLKKVFPEVEIGTSIFSLGNFMVPFDYPKWKGSSEIEYKRLAFFESKDQTKRLKFTVSKTAQGILFSAVPLINSKFNLKNYNLGLNDFKKHDYIAEYIFLQQTSDRALVDSKRILDSMVQKNEDLTRAHKEIDSLARFPGENPNPIIRLDYDLKINYSNKAAEGKFADDFDIHDGKIRDKELVEQLNSLVSDELDVKKMVIERNGRHYNFAMRNVIDKGYLNLYAADITNFMNLVLKSQDDLKAAHKENILQKEFYEFILNRIPADIAVFNLKHEYLYVNPQGIKDETLRKWMIGKTDFDYCELKNAPINIAEDRRKAFNKVIKSGEFDNWTDEFILKDGSRKVVQRTLGPLYDDDKNIRYVIGYGIDITKRKIAEEEIEKLSEFQSVLMDISNKYINMPVDRVQSAIQDSIQEIGELFDVDRVYVFDYNHTDQVSSNRFEWCSSNTTAQISRLQNISFSEIPVWVERHSKGEIIHIDRVEELPPSNFKKMIVEQDIKSLITIPLMKGDLCIGFVGMDAVKNQRFFTKDEINLLTVFSKMLVNVEQRVSFIEEIQKAQKEIERINSGLEKQVQEKTQLNLDLAKSLTDQEKFVTVGEIASGIAHDLNTPLGAIKSGAENIRYTLEQLFKDTIWKCSAEQIQSACERAVDYKGELFIGGLKMRKELLAAKDFIKSKYPDISEQDHELMANGIVKNRVDLKDKELIDLIYKSENKEDFLSLIYHIQMARSFIDTILTSGERATNVIQNLRKFIKERKSAEKTTVNLKDNINTVLNIFNYELKRDIDVQFQVDGELKILGLDIKLFQLWSNLIKNAIESMQEMDGMKFLRIVSQETKEHILVSVENNGPMIPQEIQTRIFEKYFTTKGHKSGSGLGLSIVASVVEEHNAKIELKSNELVTKFTVTFNK